MHIIQEEIGLPKITESSMGDFHSTFTVSPLPAGYGTTLGNALRRVMLSSLPGAAVTGIKVKGVTHEYTVIKGVKDSILDIMLNLKQLAMTKETKEPSIVHLKVKKGGIVTAGDIEVPSDITIHNPDLYITTLEDKNAGLDLEIRIEKGIGYRPAQIGQNFGDAEMIEIDAVFTPVHKIHYSVEAVRVGQRTDLDKMHLEVKTNGSISPKEAMRFAANVLESYFNIFNRDQKPVEPEFMSDFEKIAAKAQEEESSKPKQESYTPIEILGLSPRTLNSLINGDIGSIEQLVKCSESKLSNLRGFGKKALTEVADALEKRGLALGKDE
ncbi:DNA-directed RNA polymerase subunit alpha [Candidatus Peregrinibacteria bacterium]|nr:DNA-directed RNA polymerase subunit alpha [Candidatus Peregrinibacteria bacterium]